MTTKTKIILDLAFIRKTIDLSPKIVDFNLWEDLIAMDDRITVLCRPSNKEALLAFFDTCPFNVKFVDL